MFFVCYVLIFKMVIILLTIFFIKSGSVGYITHNFSPISALIADNIVLNPTKKVVITPIYTRSSKPVVVLNSREIRL